MVIEGGGLYPVLRRIKMRGLEFVSFSRSGETIELTLLTKRRSVFNGLPMMIPRIRRTGAAAKGRLRTLTISARLVLDPHVSHKRNSPQGSSARPVKSGVGDDGIGPFSETSLSIDPVLGPPPDRIPLWAALGPECTPHNREGRTESGGLHPDE